MSPSDFEKEELQRVEQHGAPNLVEPDMPWLDFEPADLEAASLQLEYFIAPNVLVWELTSSCPLKCEFCIGSYPQESRELSTDEKRRLAHELIEAKIWAINLSGGEPFLCPDLPWLIDLFVEHEIPVNLITTGWKLSPEQAACVAKNKERVNIYFSIDAPVAEVNDAIRGRPGAFEEGLRSFDLFRKAGVRAIGAESVITPKNIAYMDAMVDLCRSLGAQHLRFQPVVMAGRGAQDAAELALSTDQLQLIVNNLQAIRARLAQAQPDQPPFRVSLVNQAAHIATGIKTGRNWGGIIKPDGTLRVSDYLPFTFGNVREAGGFMPLWREGFKVAWKHPELQKRLADVKTIKDIERVTRDLNYTIHTLQARDCLAA